MNNENKKVYEADVELKKIKVLDNSRIRLDEIELSTLMQDIKQRGLLQPIGLLKPNPDREEYILRFGWRRLNAFRKLGYKTIPAMVIIGNITMDKLMADNVAENIHKVDLTPFEFAKVCKNYRDNDYSVGEIAVMLGESRNKIENSLSLLGSIPKEIHQDISFQDKDRASGTKGKVSITTANEIMNLRILKSQKEQLFNEVKKEEFSAQKVKIIGRMVSEGKSVKEAIKESSNYNLVFPSVFINRAEAERFKEENHISSDKKMINEILTGKYSGSRRIFLSLYKKKEKKGEQNGEE